MRVQGVIHSDMNASTRSEYKKEKSQRQYRAMLAIAFTGRSTSVAYRGNIAGSLGEGIYFSKHVHFHSP